MEETDEDDGLLDELTAMRPSETDAFACAVRASVRRNLVGATEDPFRLGRFTVLEPLGGGGMGVVFVAYDPVLDRKIALKVLRSGGDRGRREVLREGRALAQLRHPNVVAVHEVGVLDDREFVAMEYVEGKNLREWLREPRAAEQILGRLVEAGRGLAAAHAVGLVHRDLKPENLVIDVDGHARVIDFGLARPLAELTGTSPGVPSMLATTYSVHGGTPAYMAPERLAGSAGDQSSDQYSFCVTCWEALFGARPDATPARAAHGGGVPGWVRRVLERGLAADPSRRWPSMTALLTALERGRSRTRVWRAAAVVLVLAALGVAIEGVRRQDVARRVAACEASGAEIDAVWNDEARQRLRGAFTAVGGDLARATADRVIPRLDERSAAWKQARTEACLNAEVRELWSVDTTDRAVFCLEERQMDLAALVAELGRADATVLHKAAPAVASLEATDACMDERLLSRQSEPPTRGDPAIQEVREALAQAGSLGLAGKFSAALAAATRARARAEEAQVWPPLWAAARASEGHFLAETGAYAAAEAASSEAYFAAARAGAWGVAALAATKLVHVVGRRLDRYEDAAVWAEHAALAIAYAGDWSGLAEAARLNELAVVREAAGAYAEAKALHERVLALREPALGPEHPAVAVSLSNLANVHFQLAEYAEARALHERVLTIWERTLGPDHPNIAANHNNLSLVHSAAGDYPRALAHDEQALALRERVLGPEHPEVAASLANLAAVHERMGHHAQALALLERALVLQEKALGGEHLAVATTLSNLASVRFAAGEYNDVEALEIRALAIRERTLGPDHADVAYSLINLANLHETLGAHAKALAEYERALAVQRAAWGPDHPELAIALVNLGELHIDAGRPAAALPLLERAVILVEAHPGAQSAEFHAHYFLARALVAAGGDRARALVAARRGCDGFRDAGDTDAVGECESWIAEVEAMR